jgi:hypothetical protein
MCEATGSLWWRGPPSALVLVGLAPPVWCSALSESGTGRQPRAIPQFLPPRTALGIRVYTEPGRVGPARS